MARGINLLRLESALLYACKSVQAAILARTSVSVDDLSDLPSILGAMSRSEVQADRESEERDLFKELALAGDKAKDIKLGVSIVETDDGPRTVSSRTIKPATGNELRIARSILRAACIGPDPAKDTPAETPIEEAARRL